MIPATLSEVLAQSDFLSMHAPARPEVHHMLGEKHFRQMKKSAIFINTGRGATVDEEALIKALQEGWIAHAALDVLEKEPPSHNNPMLPWKTSPSPRMSPPRRHVLTKRASAASATNCHWSCRACGR